MRVEVLARVPKDDRLKYIPWLIGYIHANCARIPVRQQSPCGWVETSVGLLPPFEFGLFVMAAIANYQETGEIPQLDETK
jgi:hypothetical protein